MSELKILNKIDRGSKAYDRRPYLKISKCGKGFTGYLGLEAISALEEIHPKYNDVEFLETNDPEKIAISPIYNEARTARVSNNFGMTQIMNQYGLEKSKKYILKRFGDYLILTK